MALKAQIFRGSALLTLNEIVGNLCTLIRNFVLARILTKSDFGIAATLTVVISLLEISGRMAFGQQLVRAKDGEHRDYVGTAHFAQFSFGVLSAALILILANSFARVLKVPELAWAIKAMALIPVSSALTSLEPFTYSRRMRFGPSVAVELIPQVVITLAAYPLAIWLRDFRALVWLLVGKAFLSLAISHLVSARFYQWTMRLDYFWAMIRFGCPLLMESLLMFGALQGDRLLIASSFSLSELGGYAVAGTLAATPVIALWKVVGGVGLPVLAEVQDDRAKFEARFAPVAQGLALAAGLFGLMMLLGGDYIMVVLFGQKYKGTGAILACLSCAQSIRMIRGAPILAATALGETICLPIMSATRLSGLLLAVLVVWRGGSLLLVAWSAIAGEVLAVTTGLLLLYRLRKVPLRICLLPIAFIAAVLGGAAWFKAEFRSVSSPLFWSVAIGVCWLGLAAAFAGIFTETRVALMSLLRLLQERWRGGLQLVKKKSDADAIKPDVIA